MLYINKSFSKSFAFHGALGMMCIPRHEGKKI